jgi:5-methylcytosine-specific restriction endonuclease McrA
MANFRSDAEDARNDVRVREHPLWKPASCLAGPLDPSDGARGAGVKLEVHHRFPFAKGGSDHLTNLETLCYASNRGQRDTVV